MNALLRVWLVALAWRPRLPARAARPRLTGSYGKTRWADAIALVAWQSEHFHPLTPERINPGFSSSVFWLRAQLRNTRAEPVTYWLVLDNPRLEDVQLSQRAVGDMAAASPGWPDGATRSSGGMCRRIWWCSR